MTKSKFTSTLIAIVIFIIFCFFYSIISKKIPIGYGDEMRWVGRSYFFDFYIKRNFDNPIWQSWNSYDQPKLTEFLYGAWLYPQYLQEKSIKNEKDFDYTKFLISKGFYMIEGYHTNEYSDYYKKVKPVIVDFDETFNGFPDDYISKYGANSLKTINTIYYARTVNFILAALAVVIVYYLSYIYKNQLIAILVAFFYGFNPLLINSCLKAHSEALFVLLFNGSLLALLLYFIKKRKLVYLLAFSLFAGLCASTKLNGVMLIFVFFILNIFFFIFYESSKTIAKAGWHLFFSIFIYILVFIAVNPFVHSNPVIKITEMFRHRLKSADIQSIQFPNDYLPTPISRLNQIYVNFFNSDYYTNTFNNLYFTPLITKHSLANYPALLIFIFSNGIFSELYYAFKGSKKSVILLLVFTCILITMSFYLKLNWERYYIQLVLFIVLYQTIGVIFLYNLCKKILIKVQPWKY